MKYGKLHHAHYLLGCRFDNWLRLLRENKFKILPEKLPQALYITVTSLVMYLPSLAEKLIYDGRIKNTPMPDDPVYILGIWRSGTTYLQNLLSRDKQFGWFDPVSTATFNNCLLLRGPLTKTQQRRLKTARPMDNLEYKIDLPMEEVFALTGISTTSIIHMLAFTRRFDSYISGAFLDDLPAEKLNRWKLDYDYIIRKMNYIAKGRRLVLKSPENTGHIRQLLELYPRALFINIHREPYTVVMSTMHMFRKQLEILSLTEKPDNFDEKLEDTIIEIFRRMYTDLFSLENTLLRGKMVDIRYNDLADDPYGSLKRIYGGLGLDGYDAALPDFRRYVESQAGYRKNSFRLDDRLRQKINDKLGFYFERYGYRMEEA